MSLVWSASEAISDLILRSLPPGPREARPDDRLRKRLEGWPQRTEPAAILRDAAQERAAPQDEVGDTFTTSRDEISKAVGKMAYRPASSFRRDTIGDCGSASGAIAVKWLAPGMTPNRMAMPAAPQHSTIVRLCRRYSALSFSPTTASRLPRRGARQNNGLAARAAAWSRCSAVLIDVSTSGSRSNRPEMA